MMKKNKNLHICNHPLIQVNLSGIRDKNTSHFIFRNKVKEISRYLLYESLKDIPLKSVEIETPLEKTEGFTPSYDQFILSPILRAGLAMIEGSLDILPQAEVRHIGLYRNEETLDPIAYYLKLPEKFSENSLVIIMDPMLATGGSAIKAVEEFSKRGAKKIKFINIIASEYGVEKLLSAYPEVELYTASVDSKLNEKGYIVPGLGDAGDRNFGT